MTDSDHLNFSSLFSDADSNFTRSAGLDDLRASFSNVLITSAIAKCLDFNKYAQKNRLEHPRLLPGGQRTCDV